MTFRQTDVASFYDVQLSSPLDKQHTGLCLWVISTDYSKQENTTTTTRHIWIILRQRALQKHLGRGWVFQYEACEAIGPISCRSNAKQTNPIFSCQLSQKSFLLVRGASLDAPSQSAIKQKPTFHWEKTSVPFFVFLFMWKSHQVPIKLQLLQISR